MPYTTLVSTDALAAHLGPTGSSWTAGSTSPTRTGAASSTGVAHIPGAVYASLNDDLAGPRTGRNGRHPLPSVDALAATFGRLGIANGAQVVVYDQDAGPARQPPVVVAALSRSRRRWRCSTAAGRSGSPRGGRRAAATEIACRPRRSRRRRASGDARGHRRRAGAHGRRPDAARRRARPRTVRGQVGDDRQGGRAHSGRAEPLLQVEPRRRTARCCRPPSCARGSTTLLDGRATGRRGDVLRLRRQRLPQPAGHGARGPAGHAALRRVVVGVVGGSDAAGRNGPGRRQCTRHKATMLTNSTRPEGS